MKSSITLFLTDQSDLFPTQTGNRDEKKYFKTSKIIFSNASLYALI